MSQDFTDRFVFALDCKNDIPLESIQYHTYMKLENDIFIIGIISSVIIHDINKWVVNYLMQIWWGIWSYLDLHYGQ